MTWDRLIRFVAREDSQIHWGQPVDGQLDVGRAYADGKSPIKAIKLRSDDPLHGDGALDDIELTVAALLAPVPSASYSTSIRGLGAQYAPSRPDHPSAKAFKAPSTPVVFLKPATSIVGPSAPIVLPASTVDQDCDLEVELVVVLRECPKNVKAADALSYVLGYTIANDVSSRKLCAAGNQWGLGKNYDSWCPLGPVLVSPRIGGRELSLEARVNGKLVISDNTSNMIIGVAKLIERLSDGTSLPAGTLIATGTPIPLDRPAMSALPDQPSPWLKHGDLCELKIESVGTLINSVVEAGRKAKL